jgi:hypothetical protein
MNTEEARVKMGGTINLPTRHNSPTRQTLLANLLLVKMGAFHRMLNTEFWVRRLDDAERALDDEWATALGEPNPSEPLNPLNPAPTRDELLLWRPEAVAALHIADKLNRGLTTDPKWVRCCPHVVAYSYQIQERARQVLTHIDQLLLELDIMRAYEKAPPDPAGLVRQPRTAPGRRKRKGKVRKYHDDASGNMPKSTTIQ